MTPNPEAPRPSRRRRWLKRTAVFLAVLYLGVAAVFFAWQTAMIFPGAETQGTPAAQVDPIPPGSELVTLRAANGERVVSLFGPALASDGRPRADAARRPTILFFYGNGMCLADCLGQFEAFRHLGANVLLTDYLGYGLSGGSAGAEGCRQAATAALAYIRTRRDVDQDRLVAVGWSIGGGVALDLVARHRGEFSGLAVFSTFTSLREMAQRVVPFLPTSLMLRHEFDNLAHVGAIDVPILIGHGRDDRLIPASMSARLAAAARTPVTSFVVDHADHGDFFMVGGTDLMGRIGRFIDALPPRVTPAR